MVLKDDAFSSIVHAIEEGRIIFENIRKFIVYQLSYHFAEIRIIAGISFSLFNLPLLALQLLFLNLVSDVFPALALGLGKGDAHIMKRNPKDPQEPIINKKNWMALAFCFLLLAAAYFVPFLHDALSLEKLSAGFWLLIGAASIFTLIIIQTVKSIFKI